MLVHYLNKDYRDYLKYVTYIAPILFKDVVC